MLHRSMCFALGLMALGACNLDFSRNVQPTDGAPGDGATVDGKKDGAPVSYFQSSGGGTTSSAKYKLRLSAGLPQPMGVMSGSGHRLTIGPQAGADAR